MDHPRSSVPPCRLAPFRLPIHSRHRCRPASSVPDPHGTRSRPQASMAARTAAGRRSRYSARQGRDFARQSRNFGRWTTAPAPPVLRRPWPRDASSAFPRKPDPPRNPIAGFPAEMNAHPPWRPRRPTIGQHYCPIVGRTMPEFPEPRKTQYRSEIAFLSAGPVCLASCVKIDPAARNKISFGACARVPQPGPRRVQIWVRARPVAFAAGTGYRGASSRRPGGRSS